ncbi:MAG: ABC transporter permease [Pseudomonadota bacterium]
MRTIPFDYAVRNMMRSPVHLLATVSACTLVVFLVVGAAAFVTGMARSLDVSFDRSNVILMAAGSEDSLERSQIPVGTSGVVAADLPGIKTRLGVPYVSPEVHVALTVGLGGKEKDRFPAVVRGIAPEAFLVHSRVQIVEGRAPQSGNNEIMLGRLAGNKMGLSPERIPIGSNLTFDNRSWKIVGRFDARGSVMDAEVWAPLTDLLGAVKREGLSCLVVSLGDADLDDVDAFTKQRFDLSLTATRESDYYAGVMKYYRPVRAMVWTTAGLIALAGLLGGLNTMYASFASRVRELATLRSLGFSRPAIVLSLVQESLLAASAGTLLACFLCMLFVDGRTIRFSMGVFQLAVDHRVLFSGLAVGLITGLIGALPPAWRCLRLPIPEALRAQ